MLNKLSTEPDKFIDYLTETARHYDIFAALRALKIADIAFYRGRNKANVHLYESCLKILTKQYPSQYKVIKQFKYEKNILQDLYNKTFSEIPFIEDLHQRKEVFAGFLIYLENYLTVNRHFELQTNNELRETCYYLPSYLNANTDSITDLYKIDAHNHSIEEFTREIRDILLHFNYLNPNDIDGIELSPASILKHEKYIILLNEFWNLSHIYELWAYLDMPIKKCKGKITLYINNKKKYQAWMISNYRSRVSSELLISKHYGALIKNNKKQSIHTNYNIDISELSHRLCLDYFYATSKEITIHGVYVHQWIIAYENIKQHAISYIENRHKLRVLGKRLRDWFTVETKDYWIQLISSNGVGENDAKRIFSIWILNEKTKSKKNMGDILDHPFFKIDKNLYLLFNSVASQLEPIKCLMAIARQRQEEFKLELFLDQNAYKSPFEREIGLGLTKKGIVFASNIKVGNINDIKKDYQPIGELDFVFQVEDTLFFVECKRNLQPFLFKEYHDNHRLIQDACRQLTKTVDHVVKNKFMFKNYQKTSSLFVDEWWTNKKIEKLVIFSSNIGEYLFINNCHVIDIQVFNAFLFNKGIKLFDITNMQTVNYIKPPDTL